MTTTTTATLTPIKGILYPTYHAGWCDEPFHRLAWAEIIEGDLPDDAPPCRRVIASGFLPEMRRCDPPMPATRAKQECWEIDLEQQAHPLPNGLGYVDDDVVVLRQADSGDVMLRLTAGEARDIAAVLIQAADVMTFNRWK